jgi:hypothetical protein
MVVDVTPNIEVTISTITRALAVVFNSSR